jgi:hypothetical protein
MAKHNPPNGERSRVRILFVDGDFASGELGELTQALTQAIKPAVVIARPAVQNRLSAPLTNGTVDDAQVVMFCNRAAELFRHADSPTKRLILTTVGSNPILDGKKPHISSQKTVRPCHRRRR